MSCWWVAVSAKIINDISARFSLPLCPTGFPKLFKWNGKRNAQMEINSVGCGRETTRYVYVYMPCLLHIRIRSRMCCRYGMKEKCFFSHSLHLELSPVYSYYEYFIASCWLYHVVFHDTRVCFVMALFPCCGPGLASYSFLCMYSTILG